MTETGQTQTAVMTGAMTGAVVKKNTVVDLLQNDWKAKMALALPKHVTPDRMVRVALTAINKTPKLAQCTKESLFASLMTCSELGLEPDGRRAHLIPFNKSFKDDHGQWSKRLEVQLIIDYKGLIELAKRSGMVRVFRAELVCENDKFSYKNGRVDHEIDFRQERGNVFAVYSYVLDKDGNEDWEVMSRDDVESIRSRSKSANEGPWVSDWNEMAKKCCIRRHAKRLVLSPEFSTAIEKDDDNIELAPPVERRPVPMFDIPAEEVETTSPVEDNIPMMGAPVVPVAEPTGLTAADKLAIMWNEAGGDNAGLLKALRAGKYIDKLGNLSNLRPEVAELLLKNFDTFWTKNK